jgi:hypothetical protein
MRMTVKEFAQSQNVNNMTANAILAFLREKGMVSIVDTIKKTDNSGQPTKGKAANVYDIPESVTIDFCHHEQLIQVS